MRVRPGRGTFEMNDRLEQDARLGEDIRLLGRLLGDTIRAYEGEGPGHECVNRRFFDAPDDHPESIRAFDLRNSLT